MTEESGAAGHLACPPHLRRAKIGITSRLAFDGDPDIAFDIVKG